MLEISARGTEGTTPVRGGPPLGIYSDIPLNQNKRSVQLSRCAWVSHWWASTVGKNRVEQAGNVQGQDGAGTCCLAASREGDGNRLYKGYVCENPVSKSSGGGGAMRAEALEEVR